MSAAPSAANAARKGDQKCTAPFKFERKHPGLQRKLLKRLWAKGFDRYIKREQLAVAVVDLSRKGRTYYAGVNDNKMLYAASLPKIAILLSVINAVHKGDLEWKHEFDVRLQNMIVASDNGDASWATDLVGLTNIEKVMRSPRYCLYDNKVGGLWVGRAYRRGGATNRDPLFNISHGSTARQAARYYAMLQAGKLVTPHWSFRMLGLMSPPKHFHKFVGGLRGKNGVVFLARKSGTWRNFHADSALIRHNDAVYVLVGLSETSRGEQIMRELAQIVDEIMVEGSHRKSRRRRPKRR